MLDWTWVTGDCGETVVVDVAARVLPGVSRASLCTYPLVDWLVRRVFKRRMMNTALVKNGKVQSYRGSGVWLVEL